MTRQPIDDGKKPPAPAAEDQTHKPAKHIEETARLASSVETAKDPGKVRDTKVCLLRGEADRVTGLRENELRRPDTFGK
jgi:hypothetical protein